MLLHVFRSLVFALCSFSAFASTTLSDNTYGSLELVTGVDVWGVNAPKVRYLPNYSTEHKWDNLGGWARVKGDIRGEGSSVSGEVKFSEANGARLMRLEVAAIGSNFSLRAGVLPYRMSWCSEERFSQWVSEPDPFCRFAGLAEISTSGTGLQVVHDKQIGKWLIDSQFGVFKPSIDGQDEKLAIYVPVGPNTRHDKVGTSVSVANLKTATVWRASWLRSWQDQKSDDPKSYDRFLRYDTIFAGVDAGIAPGVEMKTTVSAYVGNQTNLRNPYKFRAISATSELNWHPAVGHVVSVAFGRYANRTVYAKDPNHHQWVAVPSVSLAYRRDFTTDAFMIVQATRSNDKTITSEGVVTEKWGSAFGVRFGRRF